MSEIEKQSQSCAEVATERMVEQIVNEYGEKYRLMAADALTWLSTREPAWGLDMHINKREFVENLIFLCDL